jgi:hypothetical protein
MKCNHHKGRKNLCDNSERAMMRENNAPPKECRRVYILVSSFEN